MFQNLKTIKAILAIGIIGSLSCGKPLVQTAMDAPLLVKHSDRFVHKPFKKVLRQVKPEILAVTGIDGEDPYVIGTFFLSFVPLVEVKKRTLEKKPPITIVVYTQATYKLDTADLPGLDKKQTLIQRYGKLPISDIQVYGSE